MTEQDFWRVVDGAGGAELYRSVDGDPTALRKVDGPGIPAPVPDWQQEIIRVRRSIGDPVAADFLLAEALPDTGAPNTAYALYGDYYDGKYFYYTPGGWKQYALKFADAYVRRRVAESGRLNAAIGLITDLIARLDPKDYITGGSAGGQSVSFPSIESVTAFYKELQSALLAQDARERGIGTGGFFRARHRPVGGVLEFDEWRQENG
jgi:hypothetical protein